MNRILICLLAIALLLAGCARGEETTAAETTEGMGLQKQTQPTLMQGAESVSSDIPFTTTDREGNEWTESCFAAGKLTILNFWEPWCGPCVGEMPDLQKISEAYADQGLQVIGIYQTPNVEDDVRQVLVGAGITYPILHYTSAFDSLQTGYVPTTVFVDQKGKIVVQPFAVSMDYDGWAEMVEENLK